MNTNKAKTNVKKTFVRNCEQKLRPGQNKLAVHDVESSKASASTQNVLEHPTLCSSEALANCLSEIKLMPPPNSVVGNIYAESNNSAKMTKKLNFHFNDQMYKNLIELNCTTEELKKSKLRKPLTFSTKKDIEPNIEDFTEEIRDEDHIPSIPVLKPRFKVVKKVETGYLNRLLVKYENL